TSSRTSARSGLGTLRACHAEPYNGCAPSLASLAVHDEEHASRLTPKLLVKGPTFRNACPPRAQMLSILDSRPFQHVDKLWPCMAMSGKDHTKRRWDNRGTRLARNQTRRTPQGHARTAIEDSQQPFPPWRVGH